jgi:hypothetical protein
VASASVCTANRFPRLVVNDSGDCEAVRVLKSSDGATSWIGSDLGRHHPVFFALDVVGGVFVAGRVAEVLEPLVHAAVLFDRIEPADVESIFAPRLRELEANFAGQNRDLEGDPSFFGRAFDDFSGAVNLERLSADGLGTITEQQLDGDSWNLRAVAVVVAGREVEGRCRRPIRQMKQIPWREHTRVWASLLERIVLSVVPDGISIDAKATRNPVEVLALAHDVFGHGSNLDLSWSGENTPLRWLVAIRHQDDFCAYAPYGPGARLGGPLLAPPEVDLSLHARLSGSYGNERDPRLQVRPRNEARYPSRALWRPGPPEDS